MKSKFKKVISTCLAAAMLLSTAVVAPVTVTAAQTQAVITGETSGDFEYYDYGGGTAEITGYTGSATELTIPSELDGKSVTSIGYGAFRNCTSLTSVTIPDGVTSIGEGAFLDCKNLTSITIPDSVTSIGWYAFQNCENLATITIPDSVTSIGDSAFDNCKSLTSITIPNSVTSIGNYAFYYCTNLATITIPDSVTSIGSGVFDNCTTLTSITIPDSVTIIGSWVFSDCTSLKSITIPESVTSIGNYAFSDCTSLTSITIPDSVTEIGSSAFNGCTSLTSITIPDGVTSIGDYAFGGCTSLKSIKIPESVTDISSAIFKDCTNLKSITIPESVTSIGGSAFENCTSLTSITIPESVTDISSAIFKDCTNLKSITIPDSVTSIGGSAFENCASLTSVTIPSGVTRIGESAFSGCTSLTSITIPESVTDISSAIFKDCTSLTSVTIPDNIPHIGGYAFSGCTSLKNLTIPESIESVDVNAFLGTDWYNNQPEGVLYVGKALYKYKGEMPQDTSIVIKNGTKSISGSAFVNCNNLVSVEIPDTVTKIGNSAFFGCTSLTSITIPESVTEIGSAAIGCYIDKNYDNYKIDDFSVSGFNGSISEKYAEEYGFNFISIGQSQTTEPTEPPTTEPEMNSNYIYFEVPHNWRNFKMIFCHIWSVDGTGTWPVWQSRQEKCEHVEGNLYRYDLSKLNETLDPQNGNAYCVVFSADTGFRTYSTIMSTDCIGDTIYCTGELLEDPEDDFKKWFEAQWKNHPELGAEKVIASSGNIVGKTYTQGADDVSLIAEYILRYLSYTTKTKVADLEARLGLAPEEVFVECAIMLDKDGDEKAKEKKIEIAKLLGLYKTQPQQIIITDKSTNVSVMLVTSEEYNLNVETLENQSISAAMVYNIELMLDGKVVQPDGKVTVKLPVPDGVDGSQCKVYHVDGDSKTDMNAVLSDGYLVFETDHFSVYAIVKTEKTSVLLGDVNADGKVNIKDATTIQKSAASLVTLTEKQNKAADVNADGKVNVNDATAIQKYTAGIDTGFKIGE